MGAKRTSRLAAVLIALVMIMTSGYAVFAADSSQRGKTNEGVATVDVEDGTIAVSGSNAQYSTDGGKTWKTVQDNVIFAKKNATVIVQTDQGTSYSWMTRATVSNTKKGKITWKKVKGAKKYTVKVYNKKGKLLKTKTVTKTSWKSSKFLKKGYKVRVRPVKVKSKKSYVGQWSKTAKIK